MMSWFPPDWTSGWERSSAWRRWDIIVGCKLIDIGLSCEADDVVCHLAVGPASGC